MPTKYKLYTFHCANCVGLFVCNITAKPLVQTHFGRAHNIHERVNIRIVCFSGGGVNNLGRLALLLALGLCNGIGLGNYICAFSLCLQSVVVVRTHNGTDGG